MKTATHDSANKVTDWRRARAILARSFYNELKSNGYSPNQIIEFSSELLGLVTGDLKSPNGGHSHSK